MERMARIRKQLLEPELLPSFYDTAWVAMVPLPGSGGRVPCFPQCVEWMLQNQQENGSWGLSQMNSSVNKDVLSSTLACVLALQRWGVGREHVRRGLGFIGGNFSIGMDEQGAAPIGFNITFPGMLSLAIEMGLEFPVRQTDFDWIFHLREMELKRARNYTKASKVGVSENEFILDNISCWPGSLLTEKLFFDGVQTSPLFKEVEYALKFPFYATMERLDHKRNIEHFDVWGSRQMLKTEYIIMPCCVNQDFLDFAMEDFTFSQSIYQDELLHLGSWAQENRLDELQFARQKLTYCYLSASAIIFPPELSDARMSWAKNGVLTTILNDFDVGGSKEHENLIALVDKWDEHSKDEFYSEQVQILFYAIYTTVNQLGARASAVQNRDVRTHLIELWIQLLRSMMTEAEWRTRQYVPTIEEYMGNAVVSFTLGPTVLTTLYFVGQKLLGCVVKDQEYGDLFRLMSTCGRLLNDIQGFERESREVNLDCVSLLVLYSDDSMSIEAAKEAIQKSIALCRKDLLMLVLREDSVVPRPCKELFWKMCKILHLFYSRTDGFSSPNEMVSSVNAVINEPLQLQTSDPCLPVQSEK